MCADSETIALNRYQRWSLAIRDNRGRPVPSMAVQVDGNMPEHRHGLPTKPSITVLGHGDYQLEGLKFNMAGLWVLQFILIADNGLNDTVTIDFNIDF